MARLCAVESPISGMGLDAYLARRAKRARSALVNPPIFHFSIGALCSEFRAPPHYFVKSVRPTMQGETLNVQQGKYKHPTLKAANFFVCASNVLTSQPFLMV